MKNEIKYKTAGDNAVLWTKTRDNSLDRSDPFGGYTCGGCGESDDAAYRSEADKHAQNCRAL